MKTNHQRGFVGRKDSERRKQGKKRHKKNPEMGRSLTGSVHAVDYPPDGFNSRIRQRENAGMKKMLNECFDEL